MEVLPVPALVEVTVTLLFSLRPAVEPLTFIDSVHSRRRHRRARQADRSGPQLSQPVTDPPQLLLPFGVDANPIPRAAVRKATPVNGVALFGVIVKLTDGSRH